MPHLGLMDSKKMSPEDAALMRAKLHIRGGKRRLRQGKISAGIVTLYDALTCAIEWYLASPEHRKCLKIKEGERLANDSHALSILERSNVLGNGFNAKALNSVVDIAIGEEMTEYDYREFLHTVESAMTKLGVMPFDESKLPPEDPTTY